MLQKPLGEAKEHLHSKAIRGAAQANGWLVPVVSLNGPRQSGKSTLVRNAFPPFEYVNLEDPQERVVAHEDPVGFLENHNAQLIIDEAQSAPNLFSAIQIAVDRENDPGQYILTGSQNFLMQRGIGQSLAGRPIEISV